MNGRAKHYNLSMAGGQMDEPSDRQKKQLIGVRAFARPKNHLIIIEPLSNPALFKHFNPFNATPIPFRNYLLNQITYSFIMSYAWRVGGGLRQILSPHGPPVQEGQKYYYIINEQPLMQTDQFL